MVDLCSYFKVHQPPLEEEQMLKEPPPHIHTHGGLGVGDELLGEVCDLRVLFQLLFCKADP